MDLSRGRGARIEALERRQLLSGIPILAQPPQGVTSHAVHLLTLTQPTVADLLTKTVRQNFLNHWSGSNKADLQAKLDANKLGAFDDALLAYMKARGGQTFFWNQSDIDGIVSFINTNLATATTIGHADDIVAHKFPEQSGSATYTVQLPAGVIDWTTQPAGVSSDFPQTLNRHEFWMDLAQAYRFTGTASYMTELINQLASWAQQNPALADPTQWAAADPKWNLLTSAQRAETWVWTYQMVLNSSGWTSGANTLFLSKLWELGDFLKRATPYAVTSNRSLFHAQGLLELAQLVPEFTEAASWETYSRTLLFNSMDAQLYPDGGHVEESPGYAGNIISDLLESYWLDQLMGDASAWSAGRVTNLNNAMNSHVQLLSPNGNLAALSDTYRQTAVSMFTKARLILSSTAWPAAKPRIRDVWLFGPTTCSGLLGAPVTPTPGTRGSAYAMTDSGYYVMRSGSDVNARQITFDAGPTGGLHGHFDLLNFELFGYGRALISDPGLYIYDTSANRSYVVSTKAHNTINVDGLNHAALEGSANPSVHVDQWTVAGDHAQVTAHHFGYAGVTGSPVLTRSIWYDLDGTALIVDWAESTTSHTYQISFNLPVDPSDPTNATGNVTGVQANGSFKSKWGTGNVQVSPLLQAGQTASRNAITFVSNSAPPNETDPAYRFTVSGTGANQFFATLVTAYSGLSTPTTTATLLTSNPQPGQAVTIRLTKNGVSQDITFTPPTLTRPAANFNNSGGSASGIAWDSTGRLHMAFFDRTSRSLKYSVRDASGKWSVVQTIDDGLDCGVYLSLALTSSGVPGVAYFDGNHGDLKYAQLVSGAWQTQTIESTGSVGLYPSLVFSRTNGPCIGYYNRTKGDLKLAIQQSATVWAISTIDSTGDVGRSCSMQLDPNRPTASKFAIAYEDTSHGWYKYAIQAGTGWNVQYVDTSTTIAGGYTSLKFLPTKNADGTYHPSVSYYDAGNSALKYASLGSNWTSTTIASTGKQGLYTTLFYDLAGAANIFYFDKTNNKAWRAKKTSSWVLSSLGSGGREMHVAMRSTGALAYSELDESVPELAVKFLAS